LTPSFNRPLVTQVARFDPWKEPLGVIAAYRLARAEIPHLQLALVGSRALADPEGWDVYRGIRAETMRDPLIHVFTNLSGVGDLAPARMDSIWRWRAQGRPRHERRDRAVFCTRRRLIQPGQ
jgi:hypothetical protein